MYRNKHTNCPETVYRESQNRTFIRELEGGVVKNVIIGLVIAKYESRSFPDKKNYGQMRYQLVFVLRDTAVDFINVVCWGQEEFINNTSQLLKVGDIVEIENCMIQTKPSSDYEEKYRPTTTSPFQINVSESHSKISQFSGTDLTEFSSIAYIPIKESNDYYTLGDIIANGHNLNGAILNLLAVVKDSGMTKNITTRTGRQMKRREVKLFDDTCLSFPMIIWDGEIAYQVDTWTPKETVLFISDVKVSFEEFRQKMVATCISKTIIIANPDSAEAHHLFNYAQSVSTFEDASLDGMDLEIDPATIQDVYDLKQVDEKLSNPSSLLSTPFYGVVCACISSFDIDCEGKDKFVVTRCTSCKRRTDFNNNQCNDGTNLCTNSECVGNQPNSTSRSFEIRLSLSDCTHGLDGFMMTRDMAQKALGCDVETFVQLTEKEKTELKWKFLLERYRFCFKGVPAGQNRQKPSLSILSMDQINVTELLQHER